MGSNSFEAILTIFYNFVVYLKLQTKFAIGIAKKIEIFMQQKLAIICWNFFETILTNLKIKCVYLKL